MSSDISAIIKSTGVALERTALEKFGAAVNDMGVGMLGNVFGTTNPSPTGVNPNPVQHDEGVWDTTRYAAALVAPDQVAFNPKLKFLFKVSFKFDPAMIEAASRLGYDTSSIERNVPFVIRHIDRPKFDYDYEEVNMYNFRTKILKQIRHREVSLTLYDDVGNNVLQFINLYRKLQSPIARMNQSPSASHGDYGFEFDETLGARDTAFRGVLPQDRIGILESMTIHQIFVERGSQNGVPASWVKSIDYVFTNPRFSNIDMDDMDHENGASFNLITISSDFDTMFMDEPKQFNQSMAPSFPGGDIPADGIGIDSNNPQGKGGNPFIDIIANQAGRAATQGLSNVFNSISRTPAGAAFSGQLSGISSLVGQAAKNTLSGLGDYARNAASRLTDESESRSRVQDLSSRND